MLLLQYIFRTVIIEFKIWHEHRPRILLFYPCFIYLEHFTYICTRVRVFWFTFQFWGALFHNFIISISVLFSHTNHIYEEMRSPKLLSNSLCILSYPLSSTSRYQIHLCFFTQVSCDPFSGWVSSFSLPWVQIIFQRWVILDFHYNYITTTFKSDSAYIDLSSSHNWKTPF